MYGKEPNCAECMPEVMEGNKEVIDVYTRVRGQHIMGMNGPVDINVVAIKTVMDLIGIENQRYIFEKVYSIYGHILSKIRSEQEAESNR